jgi:SNF2 family DNA or RNA helicase
MKITQSINKRRAEYHALLPLPKAMVHMMTVNVDYCRVGIMLDCLNDMGFRQNNGMELTTNNMQLIQQELINKGMLFKSTRGISCPESIRREALRDMLLEDSFRQTVTVLLKHIPLPDTTKQTNPFENYQQVVRSFQIALFSHKSAKEINTIENYYAYHYFRDDYRDNNLYHSILNNPFSREIMDKIHPEIRLEVALSLLERTGELLEPATEILHYIINSFHAGIIGKSATIKLINYHLLCGDKSLAHSLAANLSEDLKPEQLSRTAWLESISGNHQKADELFEQSLRYIKKRTGKRKCFLQSYAGIFHLISLLGAGGNTALNKAISYIDIAKKDQYPLSSMTEAMRPIFEDRLGLASCELRMPDRKLLENADAPLPFFLSNLFWAWTNPSEAGRNISKISYTRDKAKKNNYTWLAAELSALLEFLGHEKELNRNLSAMLHKSCNTVSCVHLVKDQPKWEKTLHALLHIASPDQKKDAKIVVDQRLIWLFNHSETYNFCYISPRIQVISKKGTWTKGRPVALQNLYQNNHIMEELTEQDRRVCRGIKEEYYRTSYKYGKTEYTMDNEIALPALVGHPLLFLESSPDVQVELVSAEPEMQLTKENGRLKLTVFPARTSDEMMVVKDTPTRFKLIRCSDKQKAIINLLGEELAIPRSGEKLAGEVVESLSSIITIHSDLTANDGTKSKTVQADCTPHAHIIPHQEGICLEFLVKPCGTEGSSFRPGKGGKTVLTEIKGEKIQAVRDFNKEKQQQDKILQSCPTFHHLEKIENQWLVDAPEDALELLLELKECGDEVILEWPQGVKLKVRKNISFTNFSMQIKQERDWFKATGSLQIDDTLALDLRTLLDMLSRATGRFVPLDDGTFLGITGQLRKRLDELNAFSEGYGKGVRFTPLAALALEDLTEEVGQLKTDKAWTQHCKRLKEVAKPQIPSTLQGSLRDYQQTGFYWLAQLSHWGVGACLADDMGLGKTIQALAAILLRASHGPTLIVAPLSVTSNWLDEAGRFAPTLNTIVFGPGDRKQTIDNLQAFDLLIVSYGLLPLETELLSGVKWQTVVLDEAQAIKNMQTKRSKAAMALQAEFRVITTGTPVENHLSELWTLFNFLNPGLLGSFKKFNEKFAIPIERDQDNEVRNLLRKLIRPFILRRLKSDVLQELPAKTEITLEVEMSNDELLLYEAQRLKALENIDAHSDEGAGQTHLRILGEIMKLRRLCCNPSLVLPDCNIASSKLKVFGDTLQELRENNHKALVFSQFVGHLEIIRRYLETKNICYQYLDGSTSLKDRKQRIANFQNGRGDVFLISLKAGGAGLNLTAADYVIHMDPWWNPAVEDQASDRAHRIGQKRPVTVYRLVVKNSIEEQIVDLHKQKRDLADSLLEGTDAAGKSSAKELLGLLQVKNQPELN